jgi:hypothetical protein
MSDTYMMVSWLPPQVGAALQSHAMLFPASGVLKGSSQPKHERRVQGNPPQKLRMIQSRGQNLGQSLGDQCCVHISACCYMQVAPMRITALHDIQWVQGFPRGKIIGRLAQERWDLPNSSI